MTTHQKSWSIAASIVAAVILFGYFGVELEIITANEAGIALIATFIGMFVWWFFGIRGTTDEIPPRR